MAKNSGVGGKSMGRGWSGSPKHTERAHGGKAAGAPQVRTGGPGKFARSVGTSEGQGMRETPASRGYNCNDGK